jgi:23S rRNA (cytosine1962-C5)-methyltransferase
MKNIILSKSGASKILRGDYELFTSDVELSGSYIPGEWVIFENEKKLQKYLGFVNTFSSENRPVAHIVGASDGVEDIWQRIELLITKSYEIKYKFLGTCFRLLHGGADNLPGLVIDCYLDCNLIQINSAGIDKYRDKICTLVTSLTEKKSIILDNEKHRAQEGLPSYAVQDLPEEINIVENEILYKVDKLNVQKNGYYFDHRLNRLKAYNTIKQANKFNIEKGLDLFSYLGSWGLNLLKAGCSHIDFVDQGDFNSNIQTNLKENGFEDRGSFSRSDVFKFLDNKIKEDEKYNVVACDPPAFCKSIKKKKNALDGYKKLINKTLRVMDDQSFLFFGSCTRYISITDLMEQFQLEAKKLNKKLYLLDIGTQAVDHTNIGFNDKSNYIKYIAYLVE